MSKEKNNIFNRHPRTTLLLTVCLGLFVCIILAEFYLYLNNPLPPSKKMSNRYSSQFLKPYDGLDRSIRLREWSPNKSHFMKKRKSYINQTDRLEVPEIGGWIIRTDDNGFIKPSKRHSEPDHSIFFLGGSTTECVCVPEDKRFPYLAGVNLERLTGRKINSYNSGVSGNNSLHSINILVNKIIPLKPDYVVMLHVVNDLGTLIHTKTYWNNLDTRKPIITNKTYNEKPLTFLSVLHDLSTLILPNLTSRFEIAFSKDEETDLDEWRDYRGKKINLNDTMINELLSDYEANLLSFISICRAWQIEPVLMTQANRFTDNPSQFVLNSLKKLREENGISYLQWKRAYDLYNEKVREVGLKENVLVIDLERHVPKNNQHLYDTVHLNDKGSELVAEIVANAIYDKYHSQ